MTLYGLLWPSDGLVPSPGGDLPPGFAPPNPLNYSPKLKRPFSLTLAITKRAVFQALAITILLLELLPIAEMAILGDDFYKLAIDRMPDRWYLIIVTLLLRFASTIRAATLVVIFLKSALDNGIIMC